MTQCRLALLPDRGVARAMGEDAVSFLQNLVTSDVERLRPGQATHAALLTPQGKILFEFFVTPTGNRPGSGLILEIAAASLPDLLKRLAFYKLRAKVTLEDVSADWRVAAAYDGRLRKTEALAIYDDPRLPALGQRVLLPAPATSLPLLDMGCRLVDEDDYNAHRIALGVPEGGRDYALGDTFPHEADMDALGGVDFKKGCFVGQEVVSRMQHRGTARKRVVPLESDAFLPDPGSEIRAGDAVIGTMGSSHGARGLALVRLDRAEEAVRGGLPLFADGVRVRLLQPAWAPFRVPEERR